MSITVALIRIVREIDTDPDLSYMGAYCNVLPPSTQGWQYVDRKKRGDWSRNEFPYWVGGHNYTSGVGAVQRRKYTLEDYERMEAYNRGDWHCLGIHAQAQIDIGGTASPLQTIRSGGLWGIDSDSGDDSLRSVEDEQLSCLALLLAEIGVVPAIGSDDDLRKHPAFEDEA